MKKRFFIANILIFLLITSTISVSASVNSDGNVTQKRTVNKTTTKQILTNKEIKDTPEDREIIDQGSLNENISWVFYSTTNSNNTKRYYLQLDGTGEIPYHGSYPWDSYVDEHSWQVTCKISSGITAIPDDFLSFYYGEFQIPTSVISIGTPKISPYDEEILIRTSKESYAIQYALSQKGFYVILEETGEGCPSSTLFETLNFQLVQPKNKKATVKIETMDDSEYYLGDSLYNQIAIKNNYTGKWVYHNIHSSVDGKTITKFKYAKNKQKVYYKSRYFYKINGKNYYGSWSKTKSIVYHDPTLNKITVYKGKKKKAAVLYSGISNTKIKWKTSNKKIATVSKKGVVKGIKYGKCKLVAKYKGKTYKTTITVAHMKPSYTAKILGRTNTNKTSFTIQIKNKGKKPLTVLTTGKYYDGEDAAFDRKLTRTTKVKIKPGKSKKITFKVKGLPTWYISNDYKAKVVVKCMYDNKKYNLKAKN